MSTLIKNQHGTFESKVKNGRPRKTKNGLTIDNITGLAHTGKPTVMTPITLKKLEEAWSLGCTDKEACFYANITQQTMYNYQRKNPEYIERKELLKVKTILLARQQVVKGLINNPEFSLKYLERKLKSEFALRTELTGSDGEAIKIQTTINIINK